MDLFFVGVLPFLKKKFDCLCVWIVIFLYLLDSRFIRVVGMPISAHNGGSALGT